MAAAPALAAELAANTNGSSRRASCQTGIAVSETSVAVYTESGAPSRAETASASTFSRGARSSDVAPPLVARIQEPTLIGEVTLKTRSMFRKRSGRPRSEISSAGLTASPAMLR